MASEYGRHDFETTDYDNPVLAYPVLSGFTHPSNVAPDNGRSYPCIPLTINSHGTPKANNKVNVITSIPIIDKGTGAAYGGASLGIGAKELHKTVLEGFIDTPVTAGYIPNVTANNGSTTVNITWADFIIWCFEGNANINSSTGEWHRVEPLWYRDPYGRVFGDYNNNGSKVRPKVIDFSASYVESVPGRTTFQMTLRV